MKIYRSLNELPANLGPTVATIGNFDGVHRGHQWVISEVIQRAHALSAQSLALTLDPHPARVLAKQPGLTLITPLEQKLELLAATGIDAALVLPFDTALSHLTAREFARDILRDRVHAVEVHEGENFRFGHHAEAGVEGLATLGRELGFDVKSYHAQSLRGQAVSSSRIRQLVSTGNVSAARALLGRPFSITGTPASGRGYGTKYTVPTINLAPYAELLPANGVYVTSLRIGIEDNAKTFEAVTNVGNRPTFGADSFTVESHLLNFHPIDVSEATPIRLSFLKFLRPEIRWPNPEALREQIGRDVGHARRYFSLCQSLSGR